MLANLWVFACGENPETDFAKLEIEKYSNQKPNNLITGFTNYPINTDEKNNEIKNCEENIVTGNSIGKNNKDNSEILLENKHDKVNSSFIHSTEFISQRYNIIKSKRDKELCVSDGHWDNKSKIMIKIKNLDVTKENVVQS